MTGTRSGSVVRRMIGYALVAVSVLALLVTGLLESTAAAVVVGAVGLVALLVGFALARPPRALEDALSLVFRYLP